MAFPFEERRRPPEGDATPGSPSPNLSRLADIMRRMGYGVIRGVHVRAGDPLFTPPFQAVRTVRLAEPGAARGTPVGSQFTPKREHLALAREFLAIGDGVVDLIKVHDGLPVALEVSEQL